MTPKVRVRSVGTVTSRIPLWLALAAIVAGTALWLGGQVKSPRQRAAEAKAPPASPVTAPVEVRRLRQMVVLRGTVRAGQEVTITLDADTGDRKPLVTKLKLEVGSKVAAGTLLLEVAGRPVFALPGQIPMYRDLRPGDRGDDVAQLQRALRGLGHSIGDRSGTFGAGTTRAIRRFFRARGYEPSAETVEPGASPENNQDSDPNPQREQSEQGGADADRARAQPDAPARKKLVLTNDEVVFVKTLPARVSALSSQVGDRVTGEAMRLTSGRPRIEVPLQTGADEEVKPGIAVEVEAETDTRMVPGRIAEVVKLKTPQGGSSGASEDEDPGGEGAGADEAEDGGAGDADRHAVITTSKPLPLALVGTEVIVRAIVLDTKSKVLAVPSAAVWTRADGSTYILVQEAPGRTRQVLVKTGRPADGYVEIADGALEPGDEAVIGRGAGG